VADTGVKVNGEGGAPGATPRSVGAAPTGSGAGSGLPRTAPTASWEQPSSGCTPATWLKRARLGPARALATPPRAVPWRSTSSSMSSAPAFNIAPSACTATRRRTCSGLAPSVHLLWPNPSKTTLANSAGGTSALLSSPTTGTASCSDADEIISASETCSSRVALGSLGSDMFVSLQFASDPHRPRRARQVAVCSARTGLWPSVFFADRIARQLHDRQVTASCTCGDERSIQH
jgi:hypothetical protein